LGKPFPLDGSTMKAGEQKKKFRKRNLREEGAKVTIWQGSLREGKGKTIKLGGTRWNESNTKSFSFKGDQVKGEYCLEKVRENIGLKRE